MEILNYHQLAKQNRRVFFQYRVEDHFFRKDQINPATIDFYSLSGNDLILTHKNYNGRKLDATDSLRDWRLINVDMTDCDPKKLSRLMYDRGIKEIKIVEIKKGKKIIFYSFSDVYIFKCEEIEQEIRGYNRREIVDMLLEAEEGLNEVDTRNSKLDDFVTRLCRFINGELKDHKNLIALHQYKNILQVTKSTHYLEILTRIKDKLDDLEKSLQEDIIKYHGIES